MNLKTHSQAPLNIRASERVAFTERCSGQVKIIACIEDPAVIERILAHLKGKEPSAEPAMLPEGRAPPQARLGVPDSSTDCMTP